MKNIHLFFILLFIHSGVFGQYYANENKNWTFGYHSGLNFNSGAPVPFFSSDSTREGTATVSDASGNLLFYTNGSTVYNRLGNIMPSGTAIAPFLAVSSTQSSVIIPMMMPPTMYYIFSVEAIEAGSGRLAFCKVDMSLDTGMGDIIPGTGMLLDDSMAEKIIAIPSGNCSIWLVTHKRNTPVFKAYEITVMGIGPPVISVSGWTTPTFNYGIGVMKASHDHRKIVLQGYHQHVELHDFNPLTGEVSGCKIIEPYDRGGYGAEFSPDNSKLYITNGGGSPPGYTIYQYDMTDTSTAAIIASKTYIGHTCTYSDLKLAADGKIYFISDSTSPAGTCTMGRIDQPNDSAAACGYVRSCIALSSIECGLGLPNTYVRVDSALTLVPIAGPDTVCLGALITLSHPAWGGVWSSDSTHTIVDMYGNVTAHLAGYDTITFTVDYGVCKAFVKHPITIYGCDIDTAVTPPLVVAPLQSDKMDVHVFPNPSKGTFNILISAGAGEQISVTITNLVGRVVKELITKAGRQTEIHLPMRGIYLLEVSGASGRRVMKVLVE